MKLNNLNTFSAPSRRSVVKAAAWTAPVAVVATAAPAFASSPGVGPGQLPAGMTTAWRARAQVDAGNVPFVAFLNLAGDDEIRYRVTGADGVVADGTYFTTATISLTWSFDQPVTPTVLALNGWVTADSVAAANAGTITYTQVLQNGDSMAVIAPQISFVPVGAAPTSGSLAANTGGVNLGTVGSSADL